MPRLKRRGHKLHDQLTDPQTWDLILGNRGAFASDQDRREAWERHCDEFQLNPLGRCAAWWDYSSPEPRNRAMKAHLQLERLGLLTIEEKTLLARIRAQRGIV